MKKLAALLLLSFLSSAIFAQIRYLTIEPNHSTIGFEVPIANGATKVTGKFTEHDLQLTYKNQDWTQSSFDFTIRVHSLTTSIPDRDRHLMSADFFDAEQFPIITFVSKRIEKTGNNAYTAFGDFTMRGITNLMEIPFTITYEENNTIGIHIETAVNRITNNVGVDFKHTSIENFISADILVRIDFWTKRDKRKGPKGIPKE
ncbi:MAG: YceI family protein [Bacteroidota bacterium]